MMGLDQASRWFLHSSAPEKRACGSQWRQKCCIYWPQLWFTFSLLVCFLVNDVYSTEQDTASNCNIIMFVFNLFNDVLSAIHVTVCRTAV